MQRIQSLWKPKGAFRPEEHFFLVTFDLKEDYLKALTGGPWMIYGSYLTTQPWTFDFDPRVTIVSKVVVWIRILGLAVRYYHRSTLNAIGKLIGEVVKIDYTTGARGRGKYARIAVLVDLMNALIPQIRVDGRLYTVAYEGLPQICFGCVKYGHIKDRCESETETNDSNRVMTGPTSSKDLPPKTSLETEGATTQQKPLYGEWMQVRYPKKGNKSNWGNGARLTGSAINEGSRYNVLFDHEDSEANIDANNESTLDDSSVTPHNQNRNKDNLNFSKKNVGTATKKNIWK